MRKCFLCPHKGKDVEPFFFLVRETSGTWKKGSGWIDTCGACRKGVLEHREAYKHAFQGGVAKRKGK